MILIFLNCFFKNKVFSFVLFVTLISKIFDLIRASIIEGATPPAPKINAFVLLFFG